MDDKLPQGKYLIDLHLHLDGALSVDTVLALAQMQGDTLPTRDREELFNLLTAPDDCKDLNEYLERFALPCSLMLTKETISETVYRTLEEQKQKGLIYAELRFAPQLHLARGLTQEEVVQAAIGGMNRSELKSNLILCCMRGEDNLQENLETVRLAEKYRHQGVVAVDLAGAEALFPTEDFEEVFAYARELGLKFTVHAGEAAGADSVMQALEFGAHRIGHGIHAADDEAVMQALKDRQVPVELCIKSNLQTKAATSLENYPLQRLLDHGIIVTLNTDNPTVSNTDMRQELALTKDKLGLSNGQIKQLLLNSVEYSFADEETKVYLAAEIGRAFG